MVERSPWCVLISHHGINVKIMGSRRSLNDPAL